MFNPCPLLQSSAGFSSEQAKGEQRQPCPVVHSLLGLGMGRQQALIHALCVTWSFSPWAPGHSSELWGELGEVGLYWEFGERVKLIPPVVRREKRYTEGERKR